MSSVCLITPHHVSFQPRVLREADTLYEAGYDVRVVCRQVDPVLIDRDKRLMQERRWRLDSVDLCREGRHRNTWLLESFRTKFFRLLFDIGIKTDNIAIRAYVKGLSQLTALAVAEPADWFIAHTQAALPIAAVAARHWNARYGFDCEDLLGELGTDPPDVVRKVESKYLPLCDYISVPSKCVADRLVEQYGIDDPLVLYNVFPQYLAAGLLPPERRQVRSIPRLHWFGQTIGPGRGIEEAVRAMGLIGQDVEFHLRGRVSASYRSRIDALAERHGLIQRIVFHPPTDHKDLIKSMDQFDIGLALERPGNGNYSRTVTNKIFSYLLAGLAVAATDTPGQQEILGQVPTSGFLYSAGSPQALADGLRPWLNDFTGLRRAQQEAWNSARQRFCWDNEQKRLLSTLHEASGK